MSDYGYTRGWCPECGPDPDFDEEGCCCICGALCTGEGAETAYVIRDQLTRARAVIEAWRPIVLAAMSLDEVDDAYVTQQLRVLDALAPEFRPEAVE